MNKTQLQKKIARLESIQDQLETELLYVDNLLKSVGFPRGVASAKEIALELLESEGSHTRVKKTMSKSI